MNLIKSNENRGASRSGFTGRRWWRDAAGLSLVFLTGCRAAPSINLLGSFFPGCMILGVAGAFAVRAVCLRTGIEPHLRPRLLVYLCLWGMITLLVWLCFFRS
jgi:hypothetical protein